MVYAAPDHIRNLLSSHWLLRHLDGAAFDRLVRHARREHYAPDQVIFRRGDAGRSMMAVLNGRVKISNDAADGRSVVFNLIDSGQIFGEIAFLDGDMRTADATAIDETELLVLHRRELLPLLERDPGLCLRLMTVLCDRLRRTTEQVEDLLFLVRPARLAKVLIWLAREYGEPVADGIRINLELSQRELGNLTGMTRESMNRQLTEWRRAGLIELVAGHVIVLRLEDMEMLVADSP